MQIQLKAGYDKSLKLGFWISDPLGENRKLPRANFPCGTWIGDWKIDLLTGIAELRQTQMKDEKVKP